MQRKILIMKNFNFDKSKKKNTKYSELNRSKTKLKWIKQKWIKKTNRKSKIKLERIEDMDVKRRRGKLKTRPDKISPLKKYIW